MLSARRRTPSLRAAAIAAAALALAASGCGSDDDGGGDGATDRQSGSSEQQSAREAVERLYEAMADGDAAGVCEELAPAAQKEIARGGLGTKANTCPEGFQGYLDAAEKAGGLDMVLKAKVARVKVDGDTAVARVTFGRDSASGDVPLVKTDEGWKLRAVGGS